MQKIRRAFDKADLNQDGMISRDELQAILKRLPGGDSWTADDFDFMFRLVDVNNDGKLSLDEFMKWVSDEEVDLDAMDGGDDSAQEKKSYDPSGSYFVSQEESGEGMLSQTLHLIKKGTRLKAVSNWIQVTAEGSGGVAEKGTWTICGSAVKVILKKGELFGDESVLPREIAQRVAGRHAYPKKEFTITFDELGNMPNATYDEDDDSD